MTRFRVVVLCAAVIALRCGGPIAAAPLPGTAAQAPATGGAAAAEGFSAAAYSGVYFGMARELVYYTDPLLGLDHYKISELNWPLEPSYYAGSTLSYRAARGLVASLDLQAGLPTGVGIMTDRDYLNYNGVVTNYSQSTARLLHSFAGRLDLGWRFPFPGGSVEPFVRYALLDFKWSASNGYYQYPPGYTTGSPPPYTPWSPSEPKVALSGVVAYYEQRYAIPALGLTATVRSRLASLGLSLAFSPFASINDIDHHLLRNLIFFDSISHCIYVAPEVSFAMRPFAHMSLGLHLSYVGIISPKNGTTISEDTTTKTYTSYVDSTSGASLQAGSATLVIHFLF